MKASQEEIDHYSRLAEERGGSIGPNMAETVCLITVEESQVRPIKKPSKPKGSIDKEKQRQQRMVFQNICLAHGLPVPEPEFKFCHRKWRFDWAWDAMCLPIGSRDRGVALEIDGGAWSQGRHTRGKGFIADQEKRNEAVCLGWKVIHCVPEDIETGKVFDWLKRLL